MILVIKEICIFMLIAQAILFFVPGAAYMKYVRILVGILMILRITEPMLDFFADEKAGKEIQERIDRLFEEAGKNEETLVIEDGSMGIYKGIEEELKKKLLECKNDYTIRAVTLDEEEGRVVITVELRNKKEKREAAEEIRINPVVLGGVEVCEEETADDSGKNGEFQDLKKQYGDCIGVDPESIIVKKEE